MSASVLVTGGAGYIGSHMAHDLVDHGYQVVVIDNLSTGHRSLVPHSATLVEGELRDLDLVRGVLTEHKVDAIMHFAGSIVVPDSVSDPLGYYLNNTITSHGLLGLAVEAKLKVFLFSSTAAIYGEPAGLTHDQGLTEAAEKAPISPYGTSKWMTEQMLADVHRAHALPACAIRYFNVAGADPKGRTGQATPKATHLIKVACEAALGKRERLALFGTDYPTPDGTCIRDYIHVTDLVAAHRLALEDMLARPGLRAYNCGYGRGFSVRDVIAAVKSVSGQDFPVDETARRAGDPPALIADSRHLRADLNWHPQYDDLNTIVGHALAWERRWNGS